MKYYHTIQKEMESKNGGDNTDSLIALNRMTYKPLYPLSIFSHTQWRQFPCLRQSAAPGETFHIDMSPGSDFIDPHTSFYSFTVVYEGGPAAALPNGSAFNYIEDTLTRARSGTELSRSSDHGLAQHYIESYTRDRNYRSSIGSGLQYGLNLAEGGHQFTVPLNSVNPFFSTNVLIPSVMGNIRLEITLPALNKPHSVAVNWQIRDMVVHAKCYSASDVVLKRLAYIAADTGLSIPYGDYSLTRYAQIASKVNMTSTKSASRGLYAFAIPSLRNRGTVGVDPMATVNLAVASVFQYNLGSNYLTTAPMHLGQESLILANEAFGMWSQGNDFGRSNYVDFQKHLAGESVLATCLERSHTLKFNGSAISSSRPLNLEATLTANNADINLFLVYLRFAIAFGSSNVAIKE